MNALYIKIIAIITMVIDHTGYVLFPHIPLFREIGRIAFPLFAFLIANGAVHTRDINKYLFRLALLAIISEPFFSMMTSGSSMNIFFTLFLAVAAISVLKHLNSSIKYFVFIVLSLLFSYIAEVIRADYAAIGVLFIIALYVVINYKLLVCFCIFVFMLLLYDFTFLFYYSLISLIPVILYDGKRGFNSNFVKWAFYLFYPIHIFILIILSEVL